MQTQGLAVQCATAATRRWHQSAGFPKSPPNVQCPPWLQRAQQGGPGVQQPGLMPVALLLHCLPVNLWPSLRLLGVLLVLVGVDEVHSAQRDRRAQQLHRREPLPQENIAAEGGRRACGLRQGVGRVCACVGGSVGTPGSRSGVGAAAQHIPPPTAAQHGLCRAPQNSTWLAQRGAWACAPAIFLACCQTGLPPQLCRRLSIPTLPHPHPPPTTTAPLPTHPPAPSPYSSRVPHPLAAANMGVRNVRLLRAVRLPREAL